MRRGLILALAGLLLGAAQFGKADPTKGVIKGTVVDEASGHAIPWVQVQIYSSPIEQPTHWMQVLTGFDGSYQAEVEPGTYVLRAQPPYSSVFPGLLPEWYNNTDSANATPVPVSAGGVAFANFSLSKSPHDGPTGKIVGTVVDEVTNEPIKLVPIIFFSTDSLKCMPSVALTGEDGTYEAILGVGSYLVKAHPLPLPPWESGYMPEWFDNVAKPEDATSVAVGDGTEETANFALGKKDPPTPAYIAGRVTDDGGNPLQDAVVIVTRTIQDLNHLDAAGGPVPGPLPDAVNIQGLGSIHGVIWQGKTDAEGRYKARVILGEQYIALAVKAGYVPEFYDNKMNPLLADVIEVTGDVSGIDFSLEAKTTPTSSVSGTVQDEAGTGVKSRLLLIPADHGMLHTSVRFGYTDESGEYTIGHVADGKYIVLAIPFEDYAPAFYKEGEYGVIHWKDAEVVEVAGDVTDIDIGVVPIGTSGVVMLAGRIVDELGVPLEGVNVFALSADDEVLGYGLTSSTGDYMIEGLPVGTVMLVADREGYDPAETEVTVSSGTFSVENVNLSMKASGPVTSDDTPLLPASYQLGQNYPNPFNPATTIRFEIPEEGIARLTVFNLIGAEVATLVDGLLQVGSHSVVWNGTDYSGRSVSSGLYFYRLTVTNTSGELAFSRVLKMTLLK
jgi:hypothetical protein